MEQSVFVQKSRPFRFKGNDIGIVLIHGFTGSPHSLKSWGETLARAGYSVECPLLPGHGTSWQDLNAKRWTDWYDTVASTFQSMRKQCDYVFVMGLSMGGTLALKLAEDHPKQIDGMVLVNPSVMTKDKKAYFTPLIKWLVPSVKGIGNDIKNPDVTEISYSRFPLKAFDSLRKLWKIVQKQLPNIITPTLIFHSQEDHVVEPINTKLILEAISSTRKYERLLKNSYHVATLDYDANKIFSGSLRFIANIVPNSEVNKSMKK